MVRKQLKILKILFLRKLYKSLRIENTTRKGIVWVDVPNTCTSRLEKDFILYDTIERLELKIKIIK